MGQSVWLNLTNREILASDGLRQLIRLGELSGVSFNLAGLVHGISVLPRYRQEIMNLAGSGKRPDEIYDGMTLKDVAETADLLFPLYEATERREGLVSLDIAPDLAFDTDASAEEAMILWQRLDRPNALIKIPATQECLPAIQQLVSEGVNVHVTALFTVDRYRDVACAYLAGLLQRRVRGMPLSGIASVAGFSLGAIDRFVESVLRAALRRGRVDPEKVAVLRGKGVVATAKVAYETYKEVFSTEGFRQLVMDGARSQRLLWMAPNSPDSVSNQLGDIRDLIGPATIACLPLEAFSDHTLEGVSRRSLEEKASDAHKTLDLLSTVGVRVEELVDQLEQEIIKEKLLVFDDILSTIEDIVIERQGDTPSVMKS